MESLPTIVVFIGVIILGIIFQSVNQIRKEKKRIRESWGKIPVKTVRDKEESLNQAYEQLKDRIDYASEIDAITWYDLDLFEVFKQVNRTHSSIGSEALYRQLRLFDFDGTRQKEMEKLIEFYEKNPKIREDIEYQFSRLGKRDRNSVVRF